MRKPTDIARYQPYYCEENIWQFCHQCDVDERRSLLVVFISNAQRTCALWSQRAARTPDEPVLWDYHVVAVDTSAPAPLVWDLDTTVGAPTSFDTWWHATFPFEDVLPAPFQPLFHLVEAATYLERFSSDRSHMRRDDGSWQAPPPDWDPIFDADEGMNLQKFIDMNDTSFGEVLTRGQFRRRFAPQA